VGLGERAGDRVRSLSGGQARRVEIARALLHRPACLLLDEASVGLDIESRENVIALVRRLVAEQRLGVLWATHLIDEIGPGDGLVLLHKGRVQFGGSVPELLEAAGRDSIRSAFKAMTGGAPGDSNEAA
jgi:ABC-2 type transport system ATP-binding protein